MSILLNQENISFFLSWHHILINEADNQLQGSTDIHRDLNILTNPRNPNCKHTQRMLGLSFGMGMG